MSDDDDDDDLTNLMTPLYRVRMLGNESFERTIQ